MLLRCLAAVVFVLGISVASSAQTGRDVRDIEGRQLFVDEWFVESRDGAALRLHPPRPAEIALRLDAPWDGIVSGYFTVLYDEREAAAGRPAFRMWYRGRPTTSRADATAAAHEVVCYAESDDGVVWRRPELGLYEIGGSDRNNVILVEPVGVTHNFSPFLDRRPGVPDDERYKGVGGTSTEGLFGFLSADGILWRPARDGPLITEGAFDSQNVVFWSEREGCYLCFLRTWPNGIRWIARSTSPDFLNWTEPENLDFGDAPAEHLYTNQIQPYFRAPQYDIGTPARFMPGRRALRDDQVAAIDLENPRNYAGLREGVSDAVLISSRGGTSFQRTFLESFARPGIGARTWVARSNYPALGLLQTSPTEMSMYISRNYGQAEHCLQRLVLRLDGFASMNAGYAGGRWTSRPFRFTLPSTEVPADAPERPRGPVEIEAGSLRSGERSLVFEAPARFAIPGTKLLGERFTLAVHVREVPAGHRRLFSAYDGGSTAPGELVLDFDSDGDLGDGSGLRFAYDGEMLVVPTGKIADWSDDASVHHVAVTWDRGDAVLYFDGREQARRKFTSAAVELRRGDLLFGEDYPPTPRTNEPFLGRADELLVLRTALDARQIERLAERGVPAIVALRGRVDGVAYDCEGEDADALFDAWRGDESRTIRLPRHAAGGARHRLWINASTSAAGELRFELRDEVGRPVPGYSMGECRPYIGDEIEGYVAWSHGAEVEPLAGRVLTMVCEMKDADLYALQFR